MEIAREIKAMEERAELIRLKQRLEHEVREIRLCLDRVGPNIQMALDRVDNIDRMIS